MSVAMRAARVPLVALVLWAALAVVAPLAMSRYAPYSLVNGPGALCAPPVPAGFGQPPASRTCGVPLTDLYEMSLPALIADTGMRSAVLLIGAATIALTLGVLIGAVSGAVRRRAFASGAVLAVTGLTAAVPSFFVAYFLQIAVMARPIGHETDQRAAAGSCRSTASATTSTSCCPFLRSRSRPSR